MVMTSTSTYHTHTTFQYFGRIYIFGSCFFLYCRDKNVGKGRGRRVGLEPKWTRVNWNSLREWAPFGPLAVPVATELWESIIRAHRALHDNTWCQGNVRARHPMGIETWWGWEEVDKEGEEGDSPPWSSGVSSSSSSSLLSSSSSSSSLMKRGSFPSAAANLGGKRGERKFTSLL
jgi:hypothetical protein